MYVFIDAANDRAFARRTETSPKDAIRDSLAVCAFAVTGFILSLGMLAAFPPAPELMAVLILSS